MERPDLPSIYYGIAYEKKVTAKRLRLAQTPAEVALWERIRGNRLNNLHFRRQFVLFGFIVDFYCRPIGLVIEVDGSVHDDQREYDRERDAILTANGITVIRFTNEQVLSDIESVLNEIVATARSKADLS